MKFFIGMMLCMKWCMCSFLLNLLGWCWLIKLYRLLVYNSMIHVLYIASCVHYPKSSLLPSAFIAALPSFTSPSLFQHERWEFSFTGPCICHQFYLYSLHPSRIKFQQYKYSCNNKHMPYSVFILFLSS